MLKRTYLALLKVDFNADYDGQNFNYVLNLDPDFILEYIDWLYQREEDSIRYDYTRDYCFLWRREDYEELMEQVIEHIYEWKQKQPIFLETSLETFFILAAEAKDKDLLQERQEQFVKKVIQHRHKDSNFMIFLFNIILLFSLEKRREFVALFLKNNKNFDEFEKLPLEPNLWSWEGSAVPMYQSRIEYFESLLPLLNTVDFLQHKQYVERYVRGLREVIEKEKKKDFMED